MRLLLFLLLMLCLIGCSPTEAQQPAEPTSTPIPTAPAVAPPTYVVQRGDVSEIFTFSGRWLPRDQASLSFEINGTVRRVNVQRGDAVQAGQLLADFQITDLEDQLNSALLELETAQAGLESGEEGSVESLTNAQSQFANARLQLENARNTSPWPELERARVSLTSAEQDVDNAQRNYDDALSRPDAPNAAEAVDQAYQALQDARNNLRTAQASYYSSAQNFNSHQTTIKQRENDVLLAEMALAQAQNGGGADANAIQAVRSAQLKIDQIRADIARSSLYAPTDGVVLEVSIQPGDQVQAYTAVIVIGRPEPKEAIASLAFSDAQRLSVGMIGVCNVINQPDTAVQCIIRRLPLSASDADQTTRIAASLQAVPDGQLIEVAMPLQVEENVLWLPPQAIRTFQNRTFVVLQTPDGPRRADVQIGLQTDERVEIISGVNEGDVVIGQ